MGPFAVGRAVQGPESMVAGLSAGGGFPRSLRSSRRPPSPRLHGHACHRAGGRHCAGRVVDIGGPGPSRSLGAGVRRAGHRRHGWARRCAPRKSGEGNAAHPTRGGMRAMGAARNAAPGRRGSHRCSRRPTGACGRSLECCNGDRRRGIRHHADGGVRWHRHGQKKPPKGMGGRMVGLRSVASIRCCGSWPGRTDTCWRYSLCKPS